MKLSALIVDDEPLAHKIILNYVSDISDLEVTGQAYLPTEALRLIREQDFDIIFLDIQMPKMTGMELLRVADTQAQVIITSAYEEYALESYELSVCDYLLKPFRLDRFIKAVDKARANFSKGQATEDQSLLIKVDKKMLRLGIDDILCLESYGNYLKIHTPEQTYLTLSTMSAMLDSLPQGYLRVHKSYVIRLTAIRSIEGHLTQLSNGMQVPISRQYRSGLLDALR